MRNPVDDRCGGGFKKDSEEATTLVWTSCDEKRGVSGSKEDARLTDGAQKNSRDVVERLYRRTY